MHGEEGHIFQPILILLANAAVLSTIFHRLHIPGLLAYLLVGLALGPTGFAVVTNVEDLRAIAELGLVFLLFVLGLEFSLPKLMAMRNTVFRLGSAQVIICTLAFFVAFYWWGMQWSLALLVSGGLALSSTAIVSRELLQLGQLHRRHGQMAIGVLLFQDLVAVGLLISVPLMAGSSQQADGYKLVLEVAKSGGILVLFFLFGRYVLPRILAEVARTRSDELLVFSALVIVLLAGVTTEAVGLSMELGAFLAGMMLGETRFKHQLEVDVRPFRDVLLALFFITIGMLIDIGMLTEYWFRIIVSGVALLAFKALIITLVAKALGESLRPSMQAGLSLAQGGEFLFALLALATREKLIPDDVASFLLSVTIVSMALTPVVIRYSDFIVDKIDALLGRFSGKQVLGDESNLPGAEAIPAKTGHVVILGFGRVGQTIARFLKQLDIPYVALDTDMVRISEAVAAEEPAYYGDSTRSDILKIAGIESAALLIISFDDSAQAKDILRRVKEINETLPVFVRTRDDSQLEGLLAEGAKEVIPETLEASLTLVSHVLLMLNVPNSKIDEVINKARSNRYKLLHGFYQGEQYRLEDDVSREILHATALTDNAWSCGKRLDELTVPCEGSPLVEVHRAGHIIPADTFADQLKPGDIVMILGDINTVTACEDYLLGGQLR
ncbi:monovalent cation:proton antiporter family protein [Aurantivibrio plasticivorans]